MLGLSPEYQTLVRWYFQPGGSDFLFYLSAFYPHLSTDASRDFSYGSSAFLSALRSIASSLPPLGLAPPVSSAVSAFPQPTAPPPPPQFFPPSSGVPQAPPPSSLSAALGWGASAVRSTVGVSSAPPVSAPFSVPPSSLPSHPPAPPFLAPPSSSLSSWGPFASRAPAPVVSAAPAVPVCAPVAPDPPSPLFRPFAVSEPASVALASASALLGFGYLRCLWLRPRSWPFVGVASEVCCSCGCFHSTSARFRLCP